MHTSARRVQTLFLAVAALAFLTVPSFAGERQKLVLSSELSDVAFAKVDTPKDSGMKVMHGVMTGHASTTDGPLTIEKASVHKFWTAYVVEGQELKVIGNEAYTLADGSEIYIEYIGSPSSTSSDGKGRGEWRVSGGTGKYDGLKGAGQYTYYPKTDSSGTKVLDGEIELPAMTN